MKINRIFTALAMVVCGSLAFTGTVSATPAENYPSKVVRLVVPYSAGGITDLLGRSLADRLSKKWGQSVIVENKPGASEAIAAAQVAKTEPDGHTILLASDAAFLTNGLLRKNLPYDPEKDFQPIMRLAEGFGFLVVRPDVPAKDLKEFLNMAQEKPDEVTFGSEAVGSPAEFRMRILGEQSGGYKMTHIPYNGMTPIVTDMLGGRVDSSWLPPHLAKPQIEAGKLRPIATNGSERNWMFPEVPTMQEQGYYGADLTFKMMIAAPSGTPDGIVAKIANDVREIMKEEDFNNNIVRANGYTTIADSPEDFQKYLDETRPVLQKIIDEAGFEIN